MGQTVYVLMELMGKKTMEWRPVAVVTDSTVAEQWQQYGANVDWVPLELDDIKYLQPGDEETGRKSKPVFQPRDISPIEQRAVETAKRQQETIERLMRIIEDQEKMLKQQAKGVKRTSPAVKQPTSALLQKSGTILEEAPDGSDDDTNGDSKG